MAQRIVSSGARWTLSMDCSGLAGLQSSISFGAAADFRRGLAMALGVFREAA